MKPLKFSNAGWPTVVTDKLRQLWNDGLDKPAIAAKLGLPYETVRGKIRRMLETGAINLNRSDGRKENGRRPTSKAAMPAKPAKAPKEKPATKPPEPPATPKREPDYTDLPPERGTVSAVDIKGNQCRWPCGDPRTRAFRFCGRTPLQGNTPYCSGHAGRAYNGKTYLKPKPPAAAAMSEA